MKKMSIVTAVLVLAMASLSQAVPWFEDTMQPGSPAVQWDSGTYKYMASTAVHGDGTLAPHGGGYKVNTQYPGDQLYHHTTSGSHFTGTNAGLWTVNCAYTLLADPTNSHSGLQRAQFDIKFSTLGAAMNFYIGEMKSSYGSLVGTTQDMLAYAAVQFAPGTTAGNVNVRLFGTTFPDLFPLNWGTTYRVFADFNTANDTAVLKITSDAAGNNVLATENGAVSLQLGATTMNALNGWHVTTFSGGGNGLGQDNFIMEQIPEPATIGLLCIGALGLLRRRK